MLILGIKFKKVIERLASDPKEQIVYLKQLGVYPLCDELALEFDESFKLLTSGLRSKGIPIELYVKLNEIDVLLESMSKRGNEHLWEVFYLDSSEWEKVRSLAIEVLNFDCDSFINIKYTLIELFMITASSEILDVSFSINIKMITVQIVLLRGFELPHEKIASIKDGLCDYNVLINEIHLTKEQFDESSASLLPLHYSWFDYLLFSKA